MLRLFDFIVRLIVLLRAGVFTFSDNRNKLGNNAQFFQRAKQDLITKVKESFHLTIQLPDSAGKNGTSTNGKMAMLSRPC